MIHPELIHVFITWLATPKKKAQKYGLILENQTKSKIEMRFGGYMISIDDSMLRKTLHCRFHGALAHSGLFGLLAGLGLCRSAGLTGFCWLGLFVDLLSLLGFLWLGTLGSFGSLGSLGSFGSFG